MTKMLASVTGKTEAEIAIAGGADIIDLKDPNGRRVGRRVACNDHRDDCRDGRSTCPSARCAATCLWSRETIRQQGGGDRRDRRGLCQGRLLPLPGSGACAAALTPLAGRTKLIAVLFADLEPDFELLPVFSGMRLPRRRWSTPPDKAKGRLLDHLPPERIPSSSRRAKALGLMTGLSGIAGGAGHSSPVAVCSRFSRLSRRALRKRRPDRSIDADAVAQIRSLIPEEETASRAARVDYRLLAARGYSPDSARPDAGNQTGSSCAISCCRWKSAPTASSTATRQKVRFDVTAEVLRTDQQSGGHAPRVLLRHHHGRHPHDRRTWPRRAERGAGRTGGGAGPGGSARRARHRAGGKARARARRRRRRDRANARQGVGRRSRSLGPLSSADAGLPGRGKKGVTS